MNLSKEDFIAIAGIFDTKLEPIHDDIRELKQDMVLVKKDVAALKQDVAVLKQDMVSVKKDVAVLKQDMVSVKKDVAALKQDMVLVKLNQETIILPRLGTIESCYLDTYHRYTNGIQQIDQLQQDVDILKDTVVQHSKKLESIA
ncbi:MAG: hypothetical protein J6I64_04075 [Lachnospiraceae bacterium]|nr:hypothetical protein [Lachnospiraceae bacterium]